MARSTSFSDDAFRALRSEKRPGESDSDVILRLRAEARARRKDPRRFLKGKHEIIFTPSEFDRLRQKMRRADVARNKER